MKTTLEIPDDLFRRMKIAAVERNTTLARLVVHLVQAGFESEKFTAWESRARNVGLDLDAEVERLLGRQGSEWNVRAFVKEHGSAQGYQWRREDGHDD